MILEKELQQDPLKSWSQLGYGMFIHFGLYSVLAGVYKGEEVKVGYSEQIQMWANINQSEYEEYTSKFTLENFNAHEIVKLAKDSGMKYIVLTTKHHDGFCLFKTETTAYNTVDSTPSGRDVVKELSDECRREGLGFGIYYSFVDWHKGHEFDHNNNNPIDSKMEDLITSQLTELLTNYGEIVEVWFDMATLTLDQSKKFKNLVRKLQPKAAINGRLWNNQGDFRTLSDNQVPDIKLLGAWQTPASIYEETWGYRSWQVREEVEDRARHLLNNYIKVRLRGGNYLLNIGPKGDGSIVDYEALVLRKMGTWINKHQVLMKDLSLYPGFSKEGVELAYKDNELYLFVLEDVDLSFEIKGLDITNCYDLTSDRELSYTYEGSKFTVNTSIDTYPTLIKLTLASWLDPYINWRKNLESTLELIDSDLHYSYSYEDLGNYYTLAKTCVKVSAYLKVEEVDKLKLQAKGKLDKESQYVLVINGKDYEQSGKELLEERTYNLQEKVDNLELEIYKKDTNNKYAAVEVDSLLIKV